MEDSKNFYVGIDWGNGFHQACQVNDKGQPIGSLKPDHDSQGIASLIEWLHAISPRDHSLVHIGIETNHGTLVEAIALHGFTLFALNPKQTDRYSSSGAKDDKRDAYIIANAVRTDEVQLRQVILDPLEILTLREVARDLEQTKGDLQICTNRLWSHLQRYYSSLLKLCPAANEAWLWELLSVATTPEKGRRLHLETLEKLLKRHRIRRFSAQQLRDNLHLDPLPVAPGVADITARSVLLLVSRLELLHGQAKELELQQKRFLDKMESGFPSDLPSDAPSPPSAAASEDREAVVNLASEFAPASQAPQVFPDAAILRSFPGVGANVSVAFLCEANAALSSRDLCGLRSLSGVAAVTKQSGKRCLVSMRRSCSLRLRNAMHHWANVSIQANAHFRSIYDRMRAAGKNHARALRGLGEHLLRVLIGALNSGTLFDAQKQKPTGLQEIPQGA